MSTYQLEQTGQQVQNILNEAPQTKLDLQSEIERATGKEGELAQAIADEKTRAEGIEGGLRTDLDAEIQRATDKDVVLENAIGAEETRAEGVEGALRDDVDAIDAVIPNQASSSNQLADKAFVNSSIATNTADFKGTYNSLEQLETEVTDANANDYAFVIGTDQTGNTVYNRYKYVEGTGWEFEYALNNSSFTASQWAAINSAITAALVAKLIGLPTAEALTTSLNDLLTAIGAEKTRAELIEAGLRTDVNANAGAIVTEKNRAEGVEGTLTNGLTGEILNRSNADTALGLRIDGEATLRENADSALQGDIDDINDLIPTQASESNQLADKEFVNSSIATNTADFKGTYNSLETLEESVTDANANDYAFVISTDEAGNTVYNRYKYVEGTGWAFEYALNNSSFTSIQWAAINSGITAALVAKLSALPTNDALTAALSAITDVIPTAASSSNKLIDAAQFVAALATKQDTLTFDSTPTANSNNPVTSQGIKNAIDAEATLRENADNALDEAKADKATTLAGYGIEDAYTKTEVNGLVSTPHQNYVTVATYASLPASGSTDTIYRVSSYDGANNQVDNTVYSEYAWNGSAYVFLDVKSQIDEVFDITVYNSNTKYADLAAALGTNGANIPQELRRGGMSVKFVQSSDNKYVQYMCKTNAWSSTPTNWEKINNVNISQNILTISGNNSGITTSYIININHLIGQSYTAFESKNAARAAITSNSALRKSGGVYAYLLDDGWYIEQYISTSLIDSAWGSEQNWLTICHNLDGNVVLISGMGTFGNITGITEKGQYFYNTSSKQLSICIYISSPMSGSNFAQVTLSTKALYKYNNAFYNWNGTDLLPILPTIDNEPTAGSNNPVSSGGVKNALDYQSSQLESQFEGAEDVLPQNPESLYITDFYGNVVAVINKNGINTLGYSQPSADSIETGKEGFKICDKNGNIAFELSSNFSFGDNLVKFIISEYNKPKVSWIDDDFLIYSNGQLAPEYEALHTWCLNNNIRLDFAFINGLYEGTPQYQDRINLAKEWLRESFNFLLHPYHDGWYNAADNTYDLSKVRSSIIDAIQCFRENYFPTGDNILVYPGSSSNFPAIVELIKNYVDCAIIATESETNHLFNNNRYGFKRYSLGFSSTRTKTKIKQDLAYFISKGDWVILETHLYDVRNDLTTLDETTNSLANILDVVNYVNTLCPLEPTYRVWKERSFMFDIINK